MLDGNRCVKLVISMEYPYYNVRLQNGEITYSDAFNDREPFDRLTHVFYIPEDALAASSELILLCEDEQTNGEDLYYAFLYGAPTFSNPRKLHDLNDSRIAPVNMDEKYLSDGVVYRHYFCRDKSRTPVHAYLLEVRTDKATVITGTLNTEFRSKNTKATVPAMIDAAVLEGKSVIAAVNADFFDIFGDNSPSGLCIKNGRIIANEDSQRPFVGIRKDGVPILTNLAMNPDIIPTLRDAVSGLQMILKDGNPYDWAPLEPFGFTRHPRTAAGVKKDGTLLLLVIDGRIPSYSNGATLLDLALFMQRLGADRAINMDGGGSSIMLIKKEDVFDVKNNPADLYRPNDGLIREEFNSILVLANRE